MEFNIDKCRVMNIGRENPHNRYSITNVTLNRSEYERHLGVQVSLDLRPRKQCIENINRPNRGLGLKAKVLLRLF